MMPASTAIGNETLPTTMIVATPAAEARRHSLNRGLFHPSTGTAPRAVEEVDAEGDVGDDVEDGNRQARETGVDVAVHLATASRG